MKNKKLVSFTSCARHTRPVKYYVKTYNLQLHVIQVNYTLLSVVFGARQPKKHCWIDRQKIFRLLTLNGYF